MNKRKPDDEFALINLSYITAGGDEVIVYCPESRYAAATQSPARKYQKRSYSAQDAGTGIAPGAGTASHETTLAAVIKEDSAAIEVAEPPLKDQHFTITYGATGYSYESIIGLYLHGTKTVTVEDTYIRKPHQIQNFTRLCELFIKAGTIKQVNLITKFDADTDVAFVNGALEELKQSLLEVDVTLDVQINANLHDREIRLDNGWVIKIGRGLDFYQKPDSFYDIGMFDLGLRKCMETKVDIYKIQPSAASPAASDAASSEN
jgi:ATP-dependent Lon protease